MKTQLSNQFYETASNPRNPRDVYHAVQEFMGIQTKKPELASTKNAKIYKSNKLSEEFLSVVMHLAPFTSSGAGNVCEHATPGCMRACLWLTGKGLYSSVQMSRKNKTRLFHEHRGLFLAWLELEIDRLRRHADEQGKILAIRLNGTSDIDWQETAPHLFRKFNDVVFYDYTKDFEKMIAYLNGAAPKNYWLTFSRTESNEEQCREVLALNGNVAAIFRSVIPSQYLGAKVVDGVSHDLRFLDEQGVIVGLKALGKARNDETGFTIDIETMAIAA